MTDETIERVARAMCRAAITKPAAVMYSAEGVEFHVNKRWSEYADHARVAVAELTQAGDGNRHHEAPDGWKILDWGHGPEGIHSGYHYATGPGDLRIRTNDRQLLDRILLLLEDEAAIIERLTPKGNPA